MKVLWKKELLKLGESTLIFIKKCNVCFGWASMHKIKGIKEQIESLDTHISLIIGSLTRYIQPLDINKQII